MISVIFGYRIAGCIVRTSNVSILLLTCNITVMALKQYCLTLTLLTNLKFISTLYSTYKITNIYQQIKDLHMECPSTSTELSVCAVYRCTSWHFTGKWQVIEGWVVSWIEFFVGWIVTYIVYAWKGCSYTYRKLSFSTGRRGRIRVRSVNEMSHNEISLRCCKDCKNIFCGSWDMIFFKY